MRNVLLGTFVFVNCMNQAGAGQPFDVGLDTISRGGGQKAYEVAAGLMEHKFLL